ncbi:hypothetical protein VTL71DRAFT_1461 [Oculimacula yallundae]|uniref:Uncharacterized protein n=1 Tax=Oculimacula yallundae TaxID=86028 RepID=A0ABR4CBX4_9HELO
MISHDVIEACNKLGVWNDIEDLGLGTRVSFWLGPSLAPLPELVLGFSPAESVLHHANIQVITSCNPIRLILF